MTDLRLVLSTCPEADAGRLAAALVEARLAACCNRLPGLVSTYWWEGRVTSDAEALLIFKVPEARLAAMVSRLQAEHPYEVPEILVLPVEQGLEAYLAWARASCSPT